MKNLSKFFVLILLGVMLKAGDLKAQDPNWSMDIIGGSPYLLSNVKSGVSPFGGFGLRYSINPLLSAQFQLNAGVLSGNNSNTDVYFSNNFLQYSVRGIFNVTALMHKPASLSKFNLYLYAGAGHLKCYKRQNFSETGQDQIRDYNSLFYVTNIGLNIRYYVNEHIDFIAGSEMNFSQSHVIDNNPGGDYDKYMMNYVGVSFKILTNSRKKQNPDWLSIKLPYEDYDNALKLAQAKASEAEISAVLAKKETETVRAESETIKSVAEAKVAKAEASSSNLLKEIGSVHFKLDTLKEMLILINQNNNNNINTMPEINPTPSKNKNQPANNSIGSFASYTQDITPAIPVVVANYDETQIKTLKNVKGPNANSVSNEHHNYNSVKAIDDNQKFAIVLGSYIKPENAFNAKKRLLEKGYHVDVVHFNDPKVQRIIIYSESIEDAQSRLSEIREKENAEAWLLTIK